ncbi:hypothetical protein FRC00_009255 [Tulasnella sp. 408]|nr:hypothetical protein FRC00_009255 [Tulasnella sp. 408]
MLLETLGVKHSAFIRLQDKAIETAKAALKDPDVSADLMKMYDLGEAFELPNLLRKLSRYRLQDLQSRDPFVRKLLSFSLYHIKREIKYHARIPVPGSWTVVGVADAHEQLEDGEIFACIHQQGKDPIYLEGTILICRSPTVHPGDVQLVKAIGKPKPGSAYDIENLANTVVFSVKGKRPLPSCLGGGDLDGDVYYLITNTELHPTHCEKPASYEDAERHTLDRDSTVKDIAEFVIEYMTHDTLGLIGVNHLRLADQRPEGVLDKDCLRYAKLHSDAVDYPKTGKAVTIDGMPKPSYIPDWYCPESSDPKNGDYYESDRALGVLFRALQLGDPEPGPIERPVTQEDLIRDALQDKVLNILNNRGVEPVDRSSFEFLFARFSQELNYQCAAHSLAQSANSRLDEGEVVIGTILGKTAAANQSRKRRVLMERLAKKSQELVRTTKRDIIGDRSAHSQRGQLARAWNCLEVAWEMAKDDEFGHRSFALVALTSVLDVLDEIKAAKQENSL